MGKSMTSFYLDETQLREKGGRRSQEGEEEDLVMAARWPRFTSS